VQKVKIKNFHNNYTIYFLHSPPYFIPHTSYLPNMRILLTNDDGIDAKGIKSLAFALKDMAEVIVVAPRLEKSATGQSITIHTPLRFKAQKVWLEDGSNVEGYWVEGTPADCTKMALGTILGHERKPDLVISGINHGSNAAINLLYSGTVGAALEATVEGIAAMAISLDKFGSDSDFSAAGYFAAILALKIHENGLPDGVCLNVNVPDLPLSGIKGIRGSHQAHSKWNDWYEARETPMGAPYYWLGGEFHKYDTHPDNDIDVMADGFVAVTPVQLDRTAYAFLDDLKKWF
jgi:5'-nucleotidase